MSTAPHKQRIPQALTGAEMMTAKMVRMKNTSDERMSAVESFMMSFPFRFDVYQVLRIGV
jgi:hypothetical protein